MGMNKACNCDLPYEQCCGNKNLCTGKISTNISVSTGTSVYSQNWTTERIDVKVYSDHIEEIFIETSNVHYLTSFGPQHSERRVYKIVYSCVDGKWNKSEKIYGKIVQPQKEYYEF